MKNGSTESRPSRVRRGFSRFAAVAILASLAASPAWSQDDTPDTEPAETPASTGSSSSIEEIVVRGAESEATRDFASADSATGFGAEDLAALGTQDIADLAAFTPNLEIVTSGSTTPTFFIRGVGLNDFNSNSTGAVAIYQDDVAINAPALQLSTLFDIEAVNVLRGPQGTGLARNASAGAIKIYSRKPSGNFGGFLRSDVGDYGFYDFEGAVEAPLHEDILAARLAFRITERDGTMKNRCGNAVPFDERVVAPPNFSTDPNNPGLVQLNKEATDPPWSQCGEPVTSGTISDIPEGLAKRVNDRDNWAARGTLLFQPTLDMTWLVNAHGARRDERTRLGQAYGTTGFTCEDGDVENCGFPGQADDSAKIDGVLGGTQGAPPAYQAPEVRERLEELAPCFGNVTSTPGDCLGTGLPTAEQNLVRADANAAKVEVARELANGLDSNPWAGDFNNAGPTTNDTYGGYVKGDIVLPYGMQLTTTTGYDHYNRKIDIDLDFSPETLFHILTKDDGWQVASDFRLQGQVDNEARIRWDLGAWFLREKLSVVVANDLGDSQAFGTGLRDYTQDLYSTGAYLSMAFDFLEDFTLDGGFRYNWEMKKLDYALELGGGADLDPVKLDDTWDSPTGTVRLTYRFREDTHAFWKYTRGWKPGTYNATSSVREDFDTRAFVPDISVAKPEEIDSFETGVRGSWFEGRLGLDLSFFYYKYSDYQLFTAQQFVNGNPEFVILNANDAEVYGAEVDASARPWQGAFVNVRFGWIESEFLDFVQLQQDEISVGNESVTVNRELQNTGNSLANAPRFKVSITAEQTVPLGKYGALTGRYDGVWTDTTYYDATEGRGIPNTDQVEFLPDDTVAQKAYWIHNLRLSWRPPGSSVVEVAAWVRNITDKANKTFAFDGSTFNATTIYFVGDPRTFGGSLTVTF